MEEVVSPLKPVGEEVARSRYYKKDDDGNIIEDWSALSYRVVNHVCKKEDEQFKKQMYEYIYNTQFLPNTPCLVNAGRETKAKGLSACYVTKAPDDTWVDIVTNIKRFGDVARAAGGCGVSFSKIRPEGDPVFGSAHAKACGPIEAMRMVSEAMSSITQSGIRGMAMMATLHVSHPDIINFIKCKQRERALRNMLKEDIFNHFEQLNGKTHEHLNIVLDKFISNFNISVFASDAFMEAVEKDADWDLIFNDKVYRTMKARELFDIIVENAWQNGDPGMLFEDAINDGPYKYSDQYIDATNPCLTGDTLVITSEGTKAIKDMCGIPHQVLSFHNNSFGWYKTTPNGAFLTKKAAKVLLIETENSKIKCTPDHKILTKSGFVEGQNLEEGELIQCNPCGIGDLYGLDNNSREEWEGFRTEISRMAASEPFESKTIEPMVSGRVWTEEDQSNDFDSWLDLLTVEKIFSKRKNVATRKEYSHCQNQGNEIGKCSRREESFLSLASESRICSEDEAVQLRLVSIEHSGKGISAEFLRMDNGDVLRLKENFVETGSSRLYFAEWRKLQTRLLHIFEKWETEENNRSKERVHFSTSWIQSGDVEANNSKSSSRINKRYIRVCPESVQIYLGDTKSMERVVRVTTQESLEDVYDLTIDNDEVHNFVANGLVVHNCSEQCLPAFGACNLGSIDVAKLYDSETNDVNWKLFKKIIHASIRFLDNVVDANVYPSKEFSDWAKDNRPVGLGIMGLADLFLKMKIKYGSKKSIELAEQIAEFLEVESNKTSVKLAQERGTPKACEYKELNNRRNVTLTSIAPTGSISLLAGCSSSIEPVFSPSIHRYDNTGQYVIEHEDAGKSYFKCALDTEQNGKREVTWKEHVAMQAAFQKYGSSGISKTINMPNSATVEDVKKAYMLAWKNKCKGITVYRDGCKTTQVLNTERKVGVVGYNNADKRSKELECDIFRTTADGINWHIIVGLQNGNPYELFAVNGKVDLPNRGKVVKKKKRYYSLCNEDGEVLVENLIEEEKGIDPKISLETRRFSLELRHQIHPKYLCSQIDKSNEHMTSFSKAINRIFKKKYISAEEYDSAMSLMCPECAKNDKKTEMSPESGCWVCRVCHHSRCS